MKTIEKTANALDRIADQLRGIFVEDLTTAERNIVDILRKLEKVEITEDVEGLKIVS